MKNDFIRTTIRDFLNDKNENAIEYNLFGRNISINERGHIVVDGIEYFLDVDSGAVKKGMLPNPSSSGAFYPSSHYDGQLQGRVYTILYKILKNAILSGMNEGDIIMKLFKANNSTENIIGGFMDYLNLELPDFDDM